MVIHWRHEPKTIRRVGGESAAPAHIGIDAQATPPDVLSETKRQQVSTFFQTVMAPAIARLLLEQEHVSSEKELDDGN